MAQRRPTKADSPAVEPTIELPNVVGFESTAQEAPQERVRKLYVEAFPTRTDRDEVLRTYAATAPNPENGTAQEGDAGKAMVALRRARDGATARARELGEQLRVAEDSIYELTQNLELVQLERDLAIQRLIASQGECDGLREELQGGNNIHSFEPLDGDVVLPTTEISSAASDATECERLRAELEEVRTRFEIQVASLQAKLAKDRSPDASPVEAEIERHQLENAALLLELEAAREQLRLLNAPALTSIHHQEPELTIVASVTDQPAALGPLPSPVELGLEHAEINRTLAELRADTSRVDLLDILAGRLRDFGSNSVAAGFPAVHRLASACTDVVSWLRKTPGRTAGSIALLEESCALIKQLFETGYANVIPDPAGASVFAVDNDEDNCECLVMALEKAAFQTRYATKADAAFGELSEARVDLIVLDVDLGDSDGFNLHDLIRQIEHHEHTPVIFVSGLLSTADRLTGLAGPPASFVAKPYNLNDLLLKALCTVVSSRLRQLAA